MNGSIIRAYKNSDLVSQKISGNEGYKIELFPGKYHFIAIYIDKSGEKYVEEEDLTLENNTLENNVVLDFIMIASYINFSESGYEIPELELNLSELETKEQEGKNNEILFGAVFLSLAAAVIAFIILRKRKRKNETRKQIPGSPEGNQVTEKFKTEKSAVKEEKENNETGIIEVTAGMENIMNTLTENELKIVKILIKHKGELRRNEISRGTGISKSSLSAALNRLEDKKIVKIDRTFTVHTVKITGWFKTIK